MKPEKHDCSRRDFLKHSLLGAVALGVASFPGEPLTGAIRNIEGRRKKTARRVVLLRWMESVWKDSGRHGLLIWIICLHRAFFH